MLMRSTGKIHRAGREHKQRSAKADTTTGRTIVIFDEQEISEMTEADLLRQVIDNYERRIRIHKHLADFCDVLDKKRQSLTNYMHNGGGYIGTEGWAAVWAMTNDPLIEQWFKHHAQFLFGGCDARK